MNELILSEHVLYVRGEVSFKTVTHLREQLQRTLHTSVQSNIRTLDCSGVTKVDSSIASLLLAALSLTKAAGTKLSIAQLPPAASKLLGLYDLDGVIQHH